MTSTPDAAYPVAAGERDLWILGQRPRRYELDPRKPYAFLVEEERTNTGEIVSISTIFLTNRECPWRCLMCDLWRNTLTQSVPSGAIPEQIDYALSRLPHAQQVKLYNSGSFFDKNAIPPTDYAAIAARLAPFQRVIVESHPSLIGNLCFRFQSLLSQHLEVAIGLETVHPRALEQLNKRMTLKQFRLAAKRLLDRGVDLRVFVLVQPPFVTTQEALCWAKQSIDFAFDCGATVTTLIPTRSGNGALDRLALTGNFSPPNMRMLEDALAYGIGLRRGRVFADLWEIQRVECCEACRQLRIARLQHMNLSQTAHPQVECACCGGRG